MKTVILCGGQGTRIREASEALPKPMLSIGCKLAWRTSLLGHAPDVAKLSDAVARFVR